MDLTKFFKRDLQIIIVILFVISSCIPSITGDINRTTDFNTKNVDNINFVPGEFIVKFKAESVVDVSESPDGWYTTGILSVDVLNEKHHVSSIEKLFECHEDQILFNIFKFNVPNYSNINSIVQEYSMNPNVIYAIPNHISHICVTPNDPDFNLQYALHNTGQTNGTIDADIDAPEAWDIEKGDENIVIAIHDTGVDYDHPDLEDNIWINTGEDLNGNGIVDPSDFNDVDDDGNGFIDDIRGWDFVDTDFPVYPGEDGTIRDNNPMDFHGHGTHCSGISSAATDNNIGMAGVCWNCSIMSVRVGYMAPSGNGYMEHDDCAVGMAYAADNGAHIVSMSWGSPDIDPLIEDAVNYSYSQGVILVAAAGNYNSIFKLYPAGYDKVIAVAATDHNDSRARFSNYGSWVDVAAPGVYIYSTLFNDTYDSWSGTSMSTPTVAGLVGLILSKNPGFNQEEVRTIIRSTGDSVISEHYIGTGRINAYKAIQRDSTPIANLNSDLDDIFIYDEITIKGTASGTTFIEYTVCYGEGIYPDGWTVIHTSSTPVSNGVLASWNPPSDLEEEICSIKLMVYDSEGQISEDQVVLLINRAPYAPDIIGPTNGKPGVDYNFTFVSNDINNDDIAEYIINWNDGTGDETIKGPFPSGIPQTTNHKWTSKGTYIIKAKAVDIYNAESDWATFDITIPRDKAINRPILNFLQSYPNLFPLLQKLIQKLGFGL
jgi:subtilisin family serine protease